MNPMQEIFKHFGMSIQDALSENSTFEKVILFLERQPVMVGYHCLIYDLRNNSNNLNVEINTQAIEDLYQITSKFNENNNKWNRARFSFFPNGKCSVEFELDEEWQKEVNRLKNQ